MTIEEKIQLALEIKAKQQTSFSFRGFYLVASFVVIFGGLFATYRLVGLPQQLNLFAAASTTPKDIQISNVTAHGFTISWKTEAVTTGFLRYGTSLENKDKLAFDSKANEGDKRNYASSTHQVTVGSALPNQVYFYSIVSRGRDYAASEGSIFTPITTLPDSENGSASNSTDGPARSGFGSLITK